MLYWIIFLSVAVALLVLTLGFYVVCMLSAVEERGDAWLCKGLTTLAVSLACYNVLLLPFQAILAKEKPEVDLVWTWKAMLLSFTVIDFVAIPFAMIHYEAWDPTGTISFLCRLAKAIKYTAALDILLGGIFFTLWLVNGQVSNLLDGNTISATSCGSVSLVDMTRVPLFSYLVALTTCIGWPLLCIFGGCGLAAVPLSGFNAFRQRPHCISEEEYEAQRAKLYLMSTNLLETGQNLDQEATRRRWSRSHQRQVLIFKRQVRELERAFVLAEKCFHIDRVSILREYVFLVFSCFSTILSVIWLLHILFNNLASWNSYLKNVFLFLDRLEPMLGVCLYATLAFYLLWCILVGFWTVGENLVLFPVFLMKKDATMPNALLFNALLLTLASTAVVHLCVMSFENYAINTSMKKIYDGDVMRLLGVREIITYSPYGLVGLALVSTILLLVYPTRQIDDDEYELLL